MTHAQQAELYAILNRSMEHAKICTIDQGPTNYVFEKQIQKGFLTISVSSRMVTKAVKLFESFLKRMFKEGFALKLDCRSFYHCPASAIIVDGEEIPVRIKEKSILKDMNNGLYSTKQFVPTGNLAIEIYSSSSWNVSKVLIETEEHKWNKLFEDVIPYLKNAAVKMKRLRIEAEAWNLKMQEEERKRKEHEKMIKDRASVVKEVMSDVILYEKAEVIRKYCDIAKQRMNCNKLYMEKLDIALQFADWVDPTIDYTDEILSERYLVKDFLYTDKN